jgi:hypothetical protein
MHTFRDSGCCDGLNCRQCRRKLPGGFSPETYGIKVIDPCAAIVKQSLWARNRIGNRVIVPARKATKAGGIDSLESIPGLLKLKKFWLWY